MANNTGLDEADVEPRRPSNPSLPKRNRSLATPPVKFRILKIHAAETRREKRPPRWEAPDFPRQRPAHCPLTLGNVGGSPTPGNHTAETGLAGWGTRIRTWEWRNQTCCSTQALEQRCPMDQSFAPVGGSPPRPTRVAQTGARAAEARRARVAFEVPERGLDDPIEATSEIIHPQFSYSLPRRRRVVAFGRLRPRRESELLCRRIV